MNAFGLVGAIFTAVGIPTFGIGIFFAINFEELMQNPNVNGSPILLPILFTALGGISLILGLILLAKHFKSKNHKKELVNGNHYVWAEVVGILDDYYIRLNGRPGKRIMAQYIEPGLTMSSSSRAIAKCIFRLMLTSDLKSRYIIIRRLDSMTITWSFRRNCTQIHPSIYLRLLDGGRRYFLLLRNAGGRSSKLNNDSLLSFKMSLGIFRGAFAGAAGRLGRERGSMDEPAP